MTARIGGALLSLLAAAACTTPAPETMLHLTQGPYLGVACPTPNSTGCDRLGIAVWLREHVPALTATIAGKSTELLAQEYSADDERGWYLEGYLQPAGLQDPPFSLPATWMGSGGPSLELALDDPRDDGPPLVVTVGVSPGWG